MHRMNPPSRSPEEPNPDWRGALAGAAWILSSILVGGTEKGRGTTVMTPLHIAKGPVTTQRRGTGGSVNGDDMKGQPVTGTPPHPNDRQPL